MNGVLNDIPKRQARFVEADISFSGARERGGERRMAAPAAQ